MFGADIQYISVFVYCWGCQKVPPVHIGVTGTDTWYIWGVSENVKIMIINEDIVLFHYVKKKERRFTVAICKVPPC